MLSQPGHQLVPNVFAAVPEENKAISVQAIPAWLNLPDYHRLPPLLGCTLGNPGDLGRGNLGAFAGLADTIVVLA